MSNPRAEPSRSMAEAVAALTRAGVKFERKSGFHVKVEAFNYWPSTGKIYRDGDAKSHSGRGLPVFIRLLTQAGLARSAPIAAVDDDAHLAMTPERSEPGFETY